MKKVFSLLLSIAALIGLIYFAVNFQDFFANDLSDMGSNEKIAHYSQLIIENPEDDEAYFERGMLYLKNGDFEAAENDFSKLISIDNDNSYAYFHRGQARLSLGKKYEAITDFEKSLEIDPDNQLAQKYLEFNKK